jgi:hypothetical protein
MTITLPHWCNHARIPIVHRQSFSRKWVDNSNLTVIPTGYSLWRTSAFRRFGGIVKLSKLSVAGAVIAMAAAATLFAHHGTATSYDQKRTLTIKGTVTQFLWRNPHSALFVEIKDDNGKSSNYAIEMWSPGLMVKQGYTRTTFKAGDQVTLEVHPSLVNEPVGECLGCKLLVNGKDPRNAK